MAEDFKTPDKFIFDQFFVQNADLKFLKKNIEAHKTGLSLPDPLRAYLGLYISIRYASDALGKMHLLFEAGLGFDEKSFEAAITPEYFRKYLRLVPGQFEVPWLIERNSLGPGQIEFASIPGGPSPAQKAAMAELEKTILEDLNRIKKDLDWKPDKWGTPRPRIFEDFNFEISNKPSLSVNTIVTRLNEFDIKEGSKEFPGGSLKKDKDETSLKFAYAFQTIKDDAGVEVIAKQVKVAGDSDNLILTADNESEITVIPKLKSLIYDGSPKSAQAIEKLVIGAKDLGSVSKIGIDKIYNVITIDIPKVDDDIDVADDLLYWLHRDPLALDLPPGTDMRPLRFAIYSYLAASYYGKLIADPSATIEKFAALLRDLQPPDILKDKISPYNDFKFDVYGLAGGPEGGQAFKFLDPPPIVAGIPTPAKGAHVFLEELNHLKNIKNAHKDSTVIHAGPWPIDPGGAIFSTALLYSSLLAAHPFKKALHAGAAVNQWTPLKPTPRLFNYSIRQLFQGAEKKDPQWTSTQFSHSDDERLSNLFKKGQLVGVRVVKSREAFDPTDTTKFDNSIVQTFYINVVQDDKNKVIRLFDSQIAYGEPYFYTLFGVYSVDGKFYYYENLVLNSSGAVWKTKTVTHVTKYKSVPGLPIEHYSDLDKMGEVVSYADYGQYKWKPFKNLETAKSNGLGTIDHTYKNPCCRFRRDEYKNVGDGDKYFGDPITWGVKEPNWVLSGVPSDRELYKVVKALVAPVYKPLNERIPAQEAAIKALTNSRWSYEIRCWLCRRAYEGGDYSIIDRVQEDMKNIPIAHSNLGLGPLKGKASRRPEFAAAVNCQDFGYKEAFGLGGLKKLPLTADMSPYAGQTAFNNPVGTLTHKSTLGLKEGQGIDQFEDRTAAILYGGDTNFLYSATTAGKPLLKGGKHRCTYNWNDLTDKVLKSWSEEVETDTPASPGKLEEFGFSIKEMNARRVYDFALEPSADATILNFVPLPPQPTFVPLEDTKDKILITFEVPTQTKLDTVEYLTLKLPKLETFQPEDGVVNTLNSSVTWGKLLEKSKKYADENKITVQPGLFVFARAEQDIREIHAYRLDRTPKNRADIVEAGEKFVLDFIKGETAYFSNLKPNQKYYYIFATRDITGLYSGGTETYEVEIVEDSGYSYTKINVYEFPKDDTKQITKSFRRLLKIKPSFENLIPWSAAWLGGFDASRFYSTRKINGQAINGLNRPPKFKIRIRSKKTKRALDINIKYTQDIKEVVSKRKLREIKKFSKLIDEKKV